MPLPDQTCKLVIELIPFQHIRPSVLGYLLPIRSCNVLLHYAIANNLVEMVELLLQLPDIDPNFFSSLDRTPLGLACLKDNTHIVRMLLNHPKTDLNIPIYGEHQPCLNVAAANGNLEICQMLLDRQVEDWVFNEGSRYGETPLHCAAKSGHLELCQLLLPYTQKLVFDADFEPPFFKAVRAGHLECAKLLLQEDKYSDPDQWVAEYLEDGYCSIPKKNPNAWSSDGTMKNMHNQYGETALQIAQENQHHHIVQFLSA